MANEVFIGSHRAPTRSEEKKPRVVAIIQARMGSKRLPGKVMMDIAGKPMLQRVIERVKLAKTVDQVVATVPSEEREAFRTLCNDCNVAVVGGPEDDVLDRYQRAAAASRADVIVRITADCPLIDPDVIDAVVEAHFTYKRDYTSNTLDRTYPRGLDVEVFTRALLERAAEEATDPHDREHVTPWMHNGEMNSVATGGTDGTINWSVNTQKDLDRVRAIYAGCVGPFGKRDDYTWQEAFQVHGSLAAKFSESVVTNDTIQQADVVTDGKPPRKVAIIGTAPSSRDLAPYQDKTWEIWSLSNRVVTDELPRWDVHFELHPLSQFETDPQARPYIAWMHQQDDSKPIYLQSPEKYPGIKAGKSFPYERLIETHGKYFTSTIAWQIALAIDEGVDEIGLWGIDLMLEDEYAHQRPCVENLLGFARAKGIKLTIPPQSSLCKPQQLYGVEGNGTPRAALDEHQKRLKGMVGQFQGERDQAALKMAHAQGAVEGLEFAKQMM